METPASTQWADFSLSRDGKSMGCLMDGSVYWWTRARGFHFMDEGPRDNHGVGMSADGSSIIAAMNGENGPRPTIWLRDGSTIDLGSLQGDCNMNHSNDGGFDLNSDGTIAVGQTASCSAEVAFVWSRAEGLHGLPNLGGSDSRGTAVSADGGLVVGYCEHPVEGFPRPAIWHDGQGPTLILGDGSSGEARNVSPNGRFVVGQAVMGSLSPQAFVWRDDSDPVVLGNLSGRATDSSLARAVSDNGTVVGWSGDETWGDQEAFIWTRKTGLLSLAAYLKAKNVDLPEGMTLTAALDISGDGNTIVGTCRDKDWKQGYWMARIGDSSDQAPVVQGNPWEPKPMDHIRPDTMETHPADILNPFPFGKRRF
jgi:uncharacterized membrane protein